MNHSCVTLDVLRVSSPLLVLTRSDHQPFQTVIDNRGRESRGPLVGISQPVRDDLEKTTRRPVIYGVQ